MTEFHLQTTTGTVVLTERACPTLPPLSHFCRIAARLASMKLDGNGGEVDAVLGGFLAGIVRSGGEVRNAYSYICLMEGIARLMVGRRDLARESLAAAYEADPLNEYVISACVDLADADRALGRWADGRYAEIALWRGRQDVLVVGDSHVLSFNGVARCETRYVGSHTMHHVGRHGLRFPGSPERHVARYSPDEESGDEGTGHQAVVLSFGEIDARVHVVRQRERTGRAVDAIVEEVVARYADAVASAFGPSPSRTIALMGLVPPIRGDAAAPGFVHGTDRERLAIHRSFNACLADRCASHGFAYVDMATGFDDPDGFIDRGVWAGDHHVSARHYRELERRLMQSLEMAAAPLPAPSACQSAGIGGQTTDSGPLP